MTMGYEADEPLSGNCDWCDRPAVVSVNGMRGCGQHIDQLFNLALAPIRTVMRIYREEKR
jgi:hypothetical protein